MSKILSLLGGQPCKTPCPVCGKGVTVLTGKRFTGWECEDGHFGVGMLDSEGKPIASTHEMPYFMPTPEAKEKP